MIFPGWLPKWLIAALDWFLGVMLNIECVPALRCRQCGAIIDIDLGLSEQEIAEKAAAHEQFFHATQTSAVSGLI